ncbi:hypothetical protein [Mycobacterium sp. URHB0021]
MPGRHPGPGTLEQSNTRLRSAWTDELHHILGTVAAETIVAHRGWPSLVRAVTASDWDHVQLLDTAAKHLLDLLAEGSDSRRSNVRGDPLLHSQK